MADDIFSDTSQQEMPQAGTAVRAHDNLVAISFLCDPADDFSRRSSVYKVFDKYARHTRLDIGKCLSRFVVSFARCGPSRLSM